MATAVHFNKLTWVAVRCLPQSTSKSCRGTPHRIEKNRTLDEKPHTGEKPHTWRATLHQASNRPTGEKHYTSRQAGEKHYTSRQEAPHEARNHAPGPVWILFWKSFHPKSAVSETLEADSLDLVNLPPVSKTANLGGGVASASRGFVSGVEGASHSAVILAQRRDSRPV